MTKLLIIESPGKQATIKKYLGADWTVLASLGHIRGLEHNLDFLTRDFEPAYEWIAQKASAIKQLKDAAKHATEIYLAADKDMEGEQIAYSVCLLLKLNPRTAKRITFTEITQKAILHAIAHPGIIDMNRVHTQQCRALLDLLIGFTMSPLLWKHVAPSLSAGRCQTPAIRLVVDREDEITSFRPSSGWRIKGLWTPTHSVGTFAALMTDELEDEESAVNYLENIHTVPTATVTRTTVKPYTESAPLPLITSTLQQQASALYHLNPKATMKIAQRLYEAGHITYMRTDKAVLSEDAQQEAMEWVRTHYGEPYVGNLFEKKKKSAKKDEVKTQEAHEAIRPTHMDLTELDEKEDGWSSVDRKVYRLIWQRTIQSVMSSMKGEIATLSFQFQDDDCMWSAHAKQTVFEGWKRAGTVASIDSEDEADEKESNDEWKTIESIKEGDSLTWTSLSAHPVETKPKPRYTEATLVRALETYGIGRPSTFASLLSVIQEKGYIESRDIPAKEMVLREYQLNPQQWPPTENNKKKKMGGEKAKLVPTDLGRSVLRFMLEHFNDLFDYGFTAQMEKRLDAISEGKEVWKSVLKDMWESYKDRYETLGSQQANAQNPKESMKRREWGEGLVSVQTKKGPLLLIESPSRPTEFLGWPNGVAFQDMTREMALAFKEEQRKKKEPSILGEWDNVPISKKSGKFGEYLQCGEISIPYQEGESLEQTLERLKAKKMTKEQGQGKTFKDYVVRIGQYGPYIMKTTLKTPQFVSLPKGVNLDTLTQKEVESFYKTGLEAKKSWKKNKENK